MDCLLLLVWKDKASTPLLLFLLDDDDGGGCQTKHHPYYYLTIMEAVAAPVAVPAPIAVPIVAHVRLTPIHNSLLPSIMAKPWYGWIALWFTQK